LDLVINHLRRRVRRKAENSEISLEIYNTDEGTQVVATVPNNEEPCDFDRRAE